MLSLLIAENLASLAQKKLSKVCNPGRCRIAGSVRRRKPQVKDIEIVCEPSNKAGFFNLRDELDASGFWKNTIDCKNGRRYFQREMFHEEEGWITIEVFVVLPPAQWGVIFAIRTGPAEQNKRIAYSLKKKGLVAADGQLFRIERRDGIFGSEEDRILIPTPEEEDFFSAVGEKYLEPEKRK